MFEKSKIIRQLANLETASGTSPPCREAIAQLVAKTGLIDQAIRFAKENREPELGAAYLVIALSEMASETNAPAVIVSALSNLLSEAIEMIKSHYGRTPVVAKILLTAALGVQVKLSPAAAWSDLNSGVSGQVTGSDSGGEAVGYPPAMHGSFQITGNMPDVTQCKPTRAFRSASYLILFLRDVPPIAEQLGSNPMQLRFTYVMAVIETQTQRPTYFVTLEKSTTAANLLGTFDSTGGHSNLGVQENLSHENVFVAKALSLIKQELGVDHIEELRR